MKHHFLFAYVVLFALSALRADAAVQLRLTVEPASQLPAIEPSLRVEATNTGSAPAELPVTVALQVARAGEEKPFIAYTGMRGNDRVARFFTGGVGSIVLQPGETRDVSFFAGPESPVWFWADSRLLSPGTFRLQLVAHPKLNSDLLEKVDRAVDQPGLLDPVVSNEATFVIQTPTGEDAAVWQLIKELPSPRSWVDALGRRIWAEHASSRYAAFCLKDPKETEPAASIAAYEAALEKQPGASWAEWYRLGIAKSEIRRYMGYTTARDVESAFAAIQRAKKILDTLIDDSPNPVLRTEASRALNRGYAFTREEIVDYVKRLNGEIREVRPFAVCVEKDADGKNVFWFGWDNTTIRETFTIPVGKDNKFTPPPFDRGQPASFPPHERVLGLRIVTDEPALTWHLEKYNVHASVAETRPCPADLQKRFTYVPPTRE